MKNIITSCLPLLFSVAVYAQENKPDFEVHEWGTFTTLSNSQGRQLTGLIKSEEAVPEFVKRIKTSWVTVTENPNPKGNGMDQFIRTYHATNIMNVNCRMETPVLYFYSNYNSLRINKVRVDYSQGSVTEFFPPAKCEDLVYSSAISLNGYRGFIEWNNVMVLADTDPKFTSTNRSLETPQWNAPRNTGSNILFTENVQEKFLFYRGLGYMESQLITRFINPYQLEIINWYSDDVPFLFVFHNKGDGRFEAYHYGKLASNNSAKVNLKRPVFTMQQGKNEMTDALVKEGLFRDEALAMLETWKESYFETEGLKVLWIWPQSLVNDRLPISIDPPPARIKRVMVGRSEVLTPQQEAKINSAYQLDKSLKVYENDRFFQCFHDMLKTYQSFEYNINFQNCLRLIVHPNPSAGDVIATIEADCENSDELEISITDFTGRIYFTGNVFLTNKKAKISLPINNQSPGIYLIAVKGEQEFATVRLVKTQ